MAAKDDPDFVKSLQDDWLAMLEKLPHDLWQASPDLQALRQDPVSQVPDRVRQATALVMGRVLQASGTST